MASFLGYVFLAIIFAWGLMLFLTVGGEGGLTLATVLIWRRASRPKRIQLR